MREMVGAVAFAAAVLGGVGWMLSGLHARFDAIDSRLVDVERRVTHIETMVELLTDRVLPYGGAPARSDGSGGGGAPCDDGSRRDTAVTLIERAPSADCGEDAR